MRMVALIAIVSCGKSDAPPKAHPVEEAPAARSASAPVLAPATADAAQFTLPTVDTSQWKRMRLSKLGKARLPFDGSISVPPGAKTEIQELHTSDGKSAGQMAFIKLPDRVEVMLGIRSSISQKDPKMLKQLLAANGPFVIDREQATGYMFVQQSDDGYIIQGASWPVEPGLDCATEKALTIDQLSEALAICDSFGAK